MTEPASLLSLIRQVRAQRHATDALEGERLRLEGSLIEFVEETWPYVDAAKSAMTSKVPIGVLENPARL
jgi:hypothetical protein